MGTKLPRWTIVLMLMAFASFAFAGGNGVNMFDMVWSETADDCDVYWGVSGPFDLDGDGFDEVIGYTDCNGLTLHLYENDGDDMYVEKWTHNITDVYYSYEVADQEVDLDRDGLPEIIVGGKGDVPPDTPLNGLFFFELDTTAEDVALTRVAGVQPHVLAGTGTGGSPSTIWAGDLDGDSVTEVLIHETELDYVMIFSLDTTSTYEFPQWNAEFVDSTLQYSAFGAVVGDLDNDGTMNFGLVEWDYNGIGFYEVIGPDEYENIYYSDDITTTDGGSLRGLTQYDFEGDGYEEVILPSVGGGLYVMTNDGYLGDFDPSVNFFTIFDNGSGFSGGQVRDVDSWHGGDGVDIITSQDTILFDFEYVGDDPTDPNSFDVYELYNDPVANDEGEELQDVLVGDFDYDGLDDIFVVSKNNPTMMAFEHDGWEWADANLVAYAEGTEAGESPGWQTRGIATGSDLDQDGYQEIIVTDYQVHGVHVFEVTGDNTIEWVATLRDDSTTYWATPRHCVTGDLDNNGLGEIIWSQFRTTGEGMNGINVWEWDGVNDNSYVRYNFPVEINGVEVDRYYGDRCVNVGDPDQDGVQELLFANNGSDNAVGDVFFIGHIDGTFSSGFYSLVEEYSLFQADGVFGGSPGYGQPNVCDMDGDGDFEVIFPAWDHAGQVIVESDGEDSYSFQAYVQLDSAFTDKVVYGTTYVTDIDGDGADDVFGGLYSAGWLWHMTGGDDVASISYDNGDIEIVNDFGAVWDVTGGDGDADGNGEVYTVDYTHARVYGYEYNGSGWDQTIVQNWSGTMGGFALDYANDLDGDGKAELVQGFLEVPYTSGNPDGLTFAVTEFNAAVGVDNKWTTITPSDYKLGQNYPNPFNPSTTIEFTLPLAKEISMTVYDMLGREVVRLADGQFYSQGSHSLTWNGQYADGRQAPAGIYLYEMRTGNVVKTAKMTLIK